MSNDTPEREAEIRARLMLAEADGDESVMMSDLPRLRYLLDALDRERGALRELREAASALVDAMQASAGGGTLFELRVVKAYHPARALLHPEGADEGKEG